MLRNFTAALIATALVAGPALAAQPSSNAGAAPAAPAAPAAAPADIKGQNAIKQTDARKPVKTGGFLYAEVVPLLTGDIDPDRVGYLGDLDLAGDDIEKNTRFVLECEVGDLEWTRLALTEDQVRRLTM